MLERNGELVYDAELTVRLDSSTIYLYTVLGYIGDTIHLGYQAEMVTLYCHHLGSSLIS